MTEDNSNYDSMLKKALEKMPKSTKALEELPKTPRRSDAKYCDSCHREISADEGRFTCWFCKYIVCEECGRSRFRWKKEETGRGKLSNRKICPRDCSNGIVWSRAPLFRF